MSSVFRSVRALLVVLAAASAWGCSSGKSSPTPPTAPAIVLSPASLSFAAAVGG